MSDSEYREEHDRNGQNGRFRVHPGLLAAVIAGGALAAYGLKNRRSAQSEAGKKGANGARENNFVRTQTIDRPASELWAFWREEENAPRFQKFIQSVHKTGSNTSHWVMEAPGGRKIEWDSEVYEERPGQLIAWRTIGGEWNQQGRVLLRPAPADRGTEVLLEMTYEMPGGPIGKALATVIGREPEQLGLDNLHRFKQLMETGEIITVAGQPHGKRGAKGKLLEVLFREPQSERRASKVHEWASKKAGTATTPRPGTSAPTDAPVSPRDRWSWAKRNTGATASSASSSTWKRLRAGT